jgi:hypothetical protein
MYFVVGNRGIVRLPLSPLVHDKLISFRSPDDDVNLELAMILARKWSDFAIGQEERARWMTNISYLGNSIWKKGNLLKPEHRRGVISFLYHAASHSPSRADLLNLTRVLLCLIRFEAPDRDAKEREEFRVFSFSFFADLFSLLLLFFIFFCFILTAFD